MAKKIMLSELFRIGSSKRVLKAQWQKEGVPFYRGREVTKLSQDGSVDNELFITEELYADLAEKYGVPSPEDIVITAIGTIGNSYIVQEGDRFYFKDASVLWLKKVADVDSRYINFWMKSPQMQEQLDEGNGATVDTLTIKKLQSLSIDPPSLLDQKRIAAILDEAFADIDHARELTERNLKNARELFDSYLQQVFSQRGEGWVEKKLQEVCVLQRGFDLPKKERKPGMYSLVSSSGVTDTNIDYKVKGPGVVTGRSGSIGNVYFIEDNFWPLNTTLYVKEFYGNDEKFVVWLLRNFDLSRFTTGAGVPTLNRNFVHDEKVFIPSDINKQNELVKNVEILEYEVKKVCKLYLQKLSALEELKKSLLQKAFSGELTSNQRDAA